MRLEQLIQDFIAVARSSYEIGLYNKAGLRHDLANYIRGRLPAEQYGVQLEREVEAVVMDGQESPFNQERMDIYLFELAGKEQFAIQIQVVAETGSGGMVQKAAENIQFMERLIQHGFRTACLLVARKVPAVPDGANPPREPEVQRVEAYAIQWQELQPASQDSNGAWKCFVVTVDNSLSQ
jgi:hypothetical protein